MCLEYRLAAVGVLGLLMYWCLVSRGLGVLRLGTRIWGPAIGSSGLSLILTANHRANGAR